MTPEYAANCMFDHIVKDARNRAICCGVDFTDEIKAILEKESTGEDIEEDFWKYVADVCKAFDQSRPPLVAETLTDSHDKGGSADERSDKGYAAPGQMLQMRAYA